MTLKVFFYHCNGKLLFYTLGFTHVDVVLFRFLFFPFICFFVLVFIKADNYLYFDFNTCFIPCVCKNNSSLGRTE